MQSKNTTGIQVEMDDNPKVGISRCEWSPSGELLATINDNMPMTVWIWNMYGTRYLCGLTKSIIIFKLVFPYGRVIGFNSQFHLCDY